MMLVLGLGLVSTLLPWALGNRLGMLPLVSPLHLLALFCGMGFLAKTIGWIFDPTLAVHPRFVPSDAVHGGALYLAGFVGALCLGYALLAGGRPVAAVRPVLRLGRTSSRRLAAAALALLGLVLLVLAALRGAVDPLSFLQDVSRAKQVRLNAEGIGSTFAGLKALLVLSKLAFVLLLATALGETGRRSTSLPALALLGAGLLVVAVASGDRFELIELGAYVVITIVITRGPPSRGMAGWLLAGAAVLVLFADLMTRWRFGAGGGEGLVRQILGSTYFLDINVASIAVDRIGAEDRLHGESYLWWSFGWVPRAIWFDKPATDLGVWFKAEVMGLSGGGAINVTGPGEAFANFGWGGIFVGLALGAGFRALEEILLAGSAARRAGCLLYPVLFYPFLQSCLQSSFSAALVTALVQLPLCLLALSFVLPQGRGWEVRHAA